MKKLFLDIETLPVEKEKHEILKEIYDKKIAEGKSTKTLEEFLAGTGLDGAFGRICCISYAFDEEKPISITGSEKEIIQKFWEIAKEANLFIGFNLLNFDLRFIYQRSIIHGVKPTVDLNFAKYRNYPIFDVMQEWSKWEREDIKSLHILARILDLPSSKDGPINASNLAKAFEDGKIKEICEYCERDVDLTRKIYKKMTFEE